MNCPKCGGELRVINSRIAPANTVRRRRECRACGYRFTIYEIEDGRIEQLIYRKNSVFMDLYAAFNAFVRQSDEFERLMLEIAPHEKGRVRRSYGSEAGGSDDEALGNSSEKPNSSEVENE